jgi:hypothetical protein
MRNLTIDEVIAYLKLDARYDKLWTREVEAKAADQVVRWLKELKRRRADDQKAAPKRDVLIKSPNVLRIEFIPKIAIGDFWYADSAELRGERGVITFLYDGGAMATARFDLTKALIHEVISEGKPAPFYVPPHGVTSLLGRIKRARATV